MSDVVRFTASFPAIQSAIKITGDGNGMRIQFDIPELLLQPVIYIHDSRELFNFVECHRDTRNKHLNSGNVD